MPLLVEVALESVQHVVGGRDARLGGRLGGADGTVTGAAQEDDRALTRCHARRAQLVDETPLRVPSVRLHSVHDIAPQ